MKELSKKLLGKMKSGSTIIFQDEEDADAFKIEESRFRELPSFTDDAQITFIDGGSQEILKGPGISLFFNRVYCGTFLHNKKIKSKVFEFYTILAAGEENGKLIFGAEIEFIRGSLDLRKYVFSPFDKKLSFGGKMLSLSSAGGIIRRLAEIAAINKIELVSANDFIVIDGSLSCIHPLEEEYFKEIPAEKRKKLCGISKTCSFVSSSGRGAASALIGATNYNEWYYSCGEQKNKTYLHFIKLNKRSRYVFKLETFDMDKKDKDLLFSFLKRNSTDLVFPGYPYGLVDADRLARVQNREKEILQIRLRTELGKEYEKIENELNSLNAHDILDNIG